MIDSLAQYERDITIGVLASIWKEICECVDGQYLYPDFRIVIKYSGKEVMYESQYLGYRRKWYSTLEDNIEEVQEQLINHIDRMIRKEIEWARGILASDDWLGDTEDAKRIIKVAEKYDR